MFHVRVLICSFSFSQVSSSNIDISTTVSQYKAMNSATLGTPPSSAASTRSGTPVPLTLPSVAVTPGSLGGSRDKKTEEKRERAAEKEREKEKAEKEKEKGEKEKGNPMHREST